MKTGDIIFTQLGSATNAISAVTEGFQGARVNHVGIIIENELGTFVLEAFPPEVRLTNINIFIKRSWDELKKPRYLISRLKPEYTHMIDKALEFGLSQRNIPYDYRYLPDQAALYCSELLVDMFKHANEGNYFFKESPMSFRDTETGEIHEYWVRHYRDYFGMPVPEGEAGSNPGDMSKDGRIHIYDVVGKISGYQS